MPVQGTGLQDGYSRERFPEEMTELLRAVEQRLPPIIPFENTKTVMRTCVLAVETLQNGAVYHLQCSDLHSSPCRQPRELAPLVITPAKPWLVASE